MLKKVSNSFGIPFVSFLSLNCFNIFWVSQNNIAGQFKNVVNRNPIFARGFHTNILTFFLFEPSCTSFQLISKSRKTIAFVGGNTLVVGSCNATIDKGFVDIYFTANRINDF